jgi:hypothetical protein
MAKWKRVELSTVELNKLIGADTSGARLVDVVLHKEAGTLDFIFEHEAWPDANVLVEIPKVDANLERLDAIATCRKTSGPCTCGIHKTEV